MIIFFLCCEQKKAHSEEVPIPTPTTALQHTQIGMCHAVCMDASILKYVVKRQFIEVVVQEWTFIIGLPNFLFSDLLFVYTSVVLSGTQQAFLFVIIYHIES